MCCRAHAGRRAAHAHAQQLDERPLVQFVSLRADSACAAGRMQDNEPLMRALSSLIVLNSPDLVLFVGEALVGNDAVDQLTKFNQRLADLSTGARLWCPCLLMVLPFSGVCAAAGSS